jgi:predicted permease
MSERIATFLREIRFAARSLARTKGLTITVVLTLALGIGANAAIFSVLRGVLLRPLVNRDEDRLIFISQSAPGLGVENTNFSVPELQDLRAVKSISAFGDFSVIGFNMVGLGEPRSIRGGVVGGSYFEVMGLHPVLGRLLDARDDGPKADGAMVLTHRFWTTALKSDPNVLGKTVRLESFGPARSATIVGVLEPSVPYPAETEIIANVVTSPHHLSATMVTGRVHRMTQLFGRLAPGATVDSALAELRAVHGAMVRQYPGDYSQKADFRINAVKLRDQITSGARTILWVLFAAAGLVFVIACSNVANLILARTVRRESELGVRAALGASTAMLRRTLLAESLLLCVGGAAVGVLIADPMLSVIARYAARFSVRAQDLTVDASMLWISAGLAVIAAVLLAYVPRLPSGDTASGFNLAAGGARVVGGANRRQRVFAITQIAASFVLLAGATMLLKTLLTLQSIDTGMDLRQVLAINVPVMSYGKTPEQVQNFYKEAIRRSKELPAVTGVAVGTVVPWRDAGSFGPGFEFSGDGHEHGPGEEDPRALFRTISGGYFAVLGVPILSGRDFNDLDRKDGEPVVIVSQSLAQRMFPGQDAVNHHIFWTDPVMQFIGVRTVKRRIIGVAADIDDEHITPQPMLTVYHPIDQEFGGGRLFVHAAGDPNTLAPAITKMIRNLSADQVVENAATLSDVRAEVLTPNRLHAVVFGVFAGVAVAIAVVGVAGVLAFSVSGRTREFGIRLAIGSQPRHLLGKVIAEGVAIAIGGIVAGAIGGYALAQVLAGSIPNMQMAGIVPLVGAAVVLLAAAIIASAWPAARAAKVDVMQALRSD